MNEILKYHSNEIKEIQNQYDLSGYCNDLSKLKVKLEEMYISYLYFLLFYNFTILLSYHLLL